MEDRNVIITILASGLVLVILASLLFQFYQTKTQDVITLSGEYKATASPDQAIVYIGINTNAKTALEAENKNKEASNKVINALKSLGVDKVETEYYSLDKSYSWENDKNVEKGYDARHNLKVSTDKLDSVGKIITTATENGANAVNNIEFKLSDEKKEEIYQSSISKATENAKSRAETLAKTAGFEIVRVKSVSLNTFGDVYPMYMAAEDVKASPVPIQPRSLDINAEVQVTFVIE